MGKSYSTGEGDWVTKWRTFTLLWGLPIAVLIAGGATGTDAIATPAALVWMGGACLLNARRCGRLHCFITGPFFLGLAVVSVLHGLDIMPLGPDGWAWIKRSTLIGGLALWFVPEFIWGKYVRRA